MGPEDRFVAGPGASADVRTRRLSRDVAVLRGAESFWEVEIVEGVAGVLAGRPLPEGVTRLPDGARGVLEIGGTTIRFEETDEAVVPLAPPAGDANTRTMAIALAVLAVLLSLTAIVSLPDDGTVSSVTPGGTRAADATATSGLADATPTVGGASAMATAVADATPTSDGASATSTAISAETPVKRGARDGASGEDGSTTDRARSTDGGGDVAHVGRDGSAADRARLADGGGAGTDSVDRGTAATSTASAKATPTAIAKATAASANATPTALAKATPISAKTPVQGARDGASGQDGSATDRARSTDGGGDAAHVGRDGSAADRARSADGGGAGTDPVDRGTASAKGTPAATSTASAKATPTAIAKATPASANATPTALAKATPISAKTPVQGARDGASGQDGSATDRARSTDGGGDAAHVGRDGSSADRARSADGGGAGTDPVDRGTASAKGTPAATSTASAKATPTALAKATPISAKTPVQGGAREGASGQDGSASDRARSTDGGGDAAHVGRDGSSADRARSADGGGAGTDPVDRGTASAKGTPAATSTAVAKATPASAKATPTAIAKGTPATAKATPTALARATPISAKTPVQGGARDGASGQDGSATDRARSTDGGGDAAHDGSAADRARSADGGGAGTDPVDRGTASAKGTPAPTSTASAKATPTAIAKATPASAKATPTAIAKATPIPAKTPVQGGARDGASGQDGSASDRARSTGGGDAAHVGRDGSAADRAGSTDGGGAGELPPRVADASAALARLPAPNAKPLVTGAAGDDAAAPLALKLRDGGQGELPEITVGPAVRGDVRVASAGKVETPVDARVGAAASSPDADVRAILDVVRGALGGLQRCYESVLRTNETLSGDVAVRWTVSNDGLPVDVTMVSSSLRNAEAEQCLVNRIRLLKFTPPRGGPVKVEFPFVFRAQGQRS